MVRGKVDLHFHTECSGDSYMPIPAVLPAAERLALRAIAKADHDSLAGCDLLAQAAAGSPVEYIPAVELSAVDDWGGTWHILGFFVDYRNRELLEACEREKQYGRLKLQRHLAAWIEAGGPGIDDPEAFLRDVAALRPYGEISFKQVFDHLVGLGYFPDTDAAKADCEQRTADFQPPGHLAPKYDEAIRLIHEAGGVAIVAHPKREDLPVVERILSAGADGIECYNVKAQRPEDRAFWRDYCCKRHLAYTGGTDWHGPVEYWNVLLPTATEYDAVESLRAAYVKRFGKKP